MEAKPCVPAWQGAFWRRQPALSVAVWPEEAHLLTQPGVKTLLGGCF